MNHTEHVHGLSVSYWRKNEHNRSIAVDKAEATWADVVPIGKYWPNFHFDLPAQAGELEKMQHIAAHCAKSGDYKARAEIRAALGVA